MARPLLAAALIVKDESAHIGACLASLGKLAPLLDHVCVYDTGSSDDTVSQARAAGAEVVLGSWDGDFSRARNAAIALTRARWVLIVDADERVHADRVLLRRALRDADDLRPRPDALTVPVRNQGDEQSYVWQSARVLRFGRACYAGTLHEQVVSANGCLPADCLELPTGALSVTHLGYTDADVRAAKLERNRRLADDAIQRLDGLNAHDPALVRALVDRARLAVAESKDETARALLRRAVGIPGDAGYRKFGWELLADLSLNAGDLDEALRAADALRAEGGAVQDWSWIRGVVAAQRENYDTALAALQIYRQEADLESAFGTTGKREKTLDALLQAATHQGDRATARDACARLMAQAGRVRGYGPILLELWAGRSTEELLAALRRHDRGYLARIHDELVSCPDPGPQLAGALSSPAGRS